MLRGGEVASAWKLVVITCSKKSSERVQAAAEYSPIISKHLTQINLLAPSGALVVIMVYYKPLFQIFQILQILKCLKDRTCAIFLKSVGCKDIKYDISVYQM